MPSPQRNPGNGMLIGGATANAANFGPLLATDNGDGTFTLVVSSGGGGGTGSVTPPGTSGTAAQAVQGITGGVPVAVTGTVAATTTFPYSETSDSQTPAAATAVGIAAFNNSTGFVERVRSVNGALNTNPTLAPGAATSANQPAINADGGSLAHVTNFPATQAVTGTFFQATQPVSGSVSVSNFPASQAVTGTFFQAVQPISGSVTATDNVTQEASVTLAAPTALGTSTTGNVRATQGAAGMVPLVVTQGPDTGLQTATYFASYTALAGVAGALVLLTGSASKVVRLRRVTFTALGTAALIDLTLVKYSTAATAGTAVTAAVVGAMDSTSAATTAAIAAYSAAPTAGTSAGIIRAQKYLLVTATASTIMPMVYDVLFNQANDQAPALRGVAQQIGLVLSAAPTAGSCDVTFEWTESAT